MQKKTKIMVFIITLVLSFAGGTLACGATEEKALSAALQAYPARTGDDVKTFEPRQTAGVDLNGDGIKDALVLLQGPYWCGTGGCSQLVFQGGQRPLHLRVDKHPDPGPAARVALPVKPGAAKAMAGVPSRMVWRRS